MNILAKTDLVDGQYYEGHGEYDHIYVAQWNAKENLFYFALHTWASDVFNVPMTYFTDSNEYYEPFKPMMLVEPREFEVVEELNERIS